MTRGTRLAVTAWPWVLSAIILAPLLLPGYVLSYDMVFVPDLAMRSDFLGFGTSLPRAVPSDAVVALVDELVPGMLLQKVVLLAALVLAGIGIQRLVPQDSAAARLAATSLYVWNPFVAERLVIGHWPLLLGYAALPWLVDEARRLRAGGGSLPRLTGWLALGALSAAGGVMTSAAALVFVAGATGARRRVTALSALAALAVNAPWIVTGLVRGADAVSDPVGAEVFAGSAEGRLPVLAAVLGLGGIWNHDVVPASRLGWLPVLSLVLVVAVCVVGWRAFVKATAPRDMVAFAACAAIGVGAALSGVVAPGLMAWVVAHVPGAGLFRDGTRYLGLLAVGQAVVFGFGAHVFRQSVREQARRVALVTGAVLLPLATMPDLAFGGAGQLVPVDYPSAYATARRTIVTATERGAVGDLLVLPFTSYRAPDWNRGHKTLDPLGRYLPVNYVASDDLYVSGRLVRGEDPRAAGLRQVMESASPDEVEAELAAGGIGWVVLDKEAERDLGTEAPRVPLSRGRALAQDSRLVLWRLEGATQTSPRTGVVVAVVGGWTAALVALLGAVVVAVTSRRGRWRSAAPSL